MKLNILAIFVFFVCTNTCFGQPPLRTLTGRQMSAPSVTNVYGRNSFSTTYKNGMKTNTVPYGRNSYINRTYGPGGFLMGTTTTVPYGNGWLTR